MLIQQKKKTSVTVQARFENAFPDAFRPAFDIQRQKAKEDKGKEKKKKEEPESNGGPDQIINIDDVKKAFTSIPDLAAEYKFVLYVDQPKKGKRKKFKLKGKDVGHTFIKLTKIGSDCNFVEKIFGFYPSKEEGGAAGSPLNKVVKSVFKNNELHPYDEAVKKSSITGEQFKSVLETASGFENAPYCLAGQNCTDFGMAAAQDVGITLPHTIAKIPLTGKGVTPADLGQDILDGKVPRQEGVTIDTSSGIATIAKSY